MSKKPIAAVGENFGAQIDEKDDEITRLKGVIDDLRAANEAKDAEIATLRAGAQKVYSDLMAANKMLAAANNPTIGVAPPARIDDLPKLDDLPNDTNSQKN